MGSKGGIGKSSISALLSEYLLDTNKEVFGIDLDAENASFAKYKKLGALHINTKNDTTGEIDKAKFDDIIPLIIENKDKEIIIDTGSTTYTPFSSYLTGENGDVIKLLKDEGVPVTIVGIVMGGGNTLDSLNALKKLGEDFPATKLLVFNNQLNGSTTFNGTELPDTKVVKNLSDRITSIVNIPQKSGYIYDNISSFAQKRLLFSDLKTSDFSMMERRRLTVYRDEIWEQFKDTFRG